MTPPVLRLLDAEPRAWTFDGTRVAVGLDPRVFPPEVAVRAAYGLMDRAWVHVHHEGAELAVILRSKSPDVTIERLVDELGNALVDARVRADLRAESADIHAAIAMEAFAPVRNRP